MMVGGGEDVEAGGSSVLLNAVTTNMTGMHLVNGGSNETGGGGSKGETKKKVRKKSKTLNVPGSMFLGSGLGLRKSMMD